MYDQQGQFFIVSLRHHMFIFLFLTRTHLFYYENVHYCCYYSEPSESSSSSHSSSQSARVHLLVFFNSRTAIFTPFLCIAANLGVKGLGRMRFFGLSPLKNKGLINSSGGVEFKKGRTFLNSTNPQSPEPKK
jgi:hypothetical protein